MITYKFRLEGPKTELKKMVTDMDRAALLAMQQAAQDLLQEIKNRAPVDTGSYRDSWRIEKVTDTRARLVTPQGRLFNMLEFTGARPHIITPRFKQWLRFPVDQFSAAPVADIDPESGGKIVFAKKVQHPGFRPIPHARPAMRAVQREVPEMVFDHFSKENKLTKSGRLKKVRIRRKVTKKTGRKVLRRKRVVRVQIDRPN